MGHKSKLIWWFLLGLNLGILLAFLTSCKSVEYVEVPVVHTDTVYQSKLVHDSIYQHDSITIREKGDSVLIERWHTRYIERELTDTIYKSVHDSIPYPVEKRVEVPAELTWWQQTLTKLGWAMIAVIILMTLYLILKLKFKQKL